VSHLNRVRALARREPSTVVLAVATLAWTFVMYLAVWRRHDRYGSFDLDLGFHTQLVWQLARGRSFSTILGLSAFGHNATFGYFLLAPLSWAGLGSPQSLDLINTLAVASAVVPIHVLARRRLGAGWPAAAIAMAWLLHPVVQNLVWETFHPEVVAVPFLLWAYVFADGRRWAPYWGCLGLAIAWKADVALFLVMLGAWVAWRRHRDVGLVTVAIGWTWAVVMLLVVIPGSSDGGTVYGALYGDLGDAPTEVALNSIRHPDRALRHLRDSDPVRYSRDLLAPYGLVPAIAPSAAALALPQYAIDLLSEDPSPRRFDWAPHYQALPMVALSIALVEAMGLLRHRWAGMVVPVCGVVVACGLATTVASGALPIGVKRQQFWSEDGDPLRAAKDAAVDVVGADDGVSASYLLTAHLAEREVAYTFPNPWRKQFYGVEATPRGRPQDVELLVLDETLVSVTDREVLACVLGAGTFDEAFREETIVVYRRLAGVAATDAACT
jgi:uncharacterized membrane protein